MWLKDWMEVVEYRITEGTEFQWQCYGPNAYQLDSWNGDHNGHSFTVIFDTKTQLLYEVQAHDYGNNRAYRWTHPDYVKARQAEEDTHGEFAKMAWEDVNYTDLEVEEDWLDKAAAIYVGEDYDTRVQVPIDFTDEELLTLMKLAHERDITFNQLVEEALKEAIEKEKHRG